MTAIKLSVVSAAWVGLGWLLRRARLLLRKRTGRHAGGAR